MRVSVITPVYNAAEFVTRAVESALAQPEVAEVLLIEDGSPDGSLAICQALAEQHDRVKLLRHPGGANRGAGASRNLGMRNASCEYIGFVDADNFYLPDRFTTAKGIFATNPDCEGVYEVIGNYIEDEAGLQRWLKAGREPDKLTGLNRAVQPEELAEKLIVGGCGGLTLDGLLIKRSVIGKAGTMAENLRLHQDTDFIIRVALMAKLYPGSLDEPVALRGVHDHNRLTAPRSAMQEYRNRMAFWMSLHKWAKVQRHTDAQRMILTGITRYTKAHPYFRNFPVDFFPTRLIYWVRFLRLAGYPQIILDLLRGRKAT